jgi:2-keto-4-pentenoate hydratase/2-oxohepta-3-ene-1,7-dioic acid hydratase in catechol pathway
MPPFDPGKVICIGLNYVDHSAETGLALPVAPLLFAKLGSSVIGHGDPIVLPPGSTQVDYEAELGVVIGQPARHVPVDAALDVVAGYTCVNDVSARDFQFADGQWFRGKSQDTFCPLGPVLVPAADVPDPQALEIECRVNGELRQRASTADMIFGVAELVSYISHGITLEPGDLIATGTQAGVGMSMEPPRYLADGDVVEVSIVGVGVLRNPVVAGRPPTL